LVPAVFVIWVRRHIEDSEVYRTTREARGTVGFSHLFSAFRGVHLATTLKVSIMVAGAQGAGYAIGIWMPTYLRTVRHFSATATGGVLLLQILGALFGFLLGSYLSDAIGRKQTFMWSAVFSLIFIACFMWIPMNDTWLLIMGVPLNVALLMKFPPMGPFMTELFPTELRGNAQGFCYNSGRAIGSFFPTLVGFLSQSWSLGNAIAVCSVIASGLMIVTLMTLPETRGRAVANIGETAAAE
jgi:sugar phosphate permease